VSYESPYKDPRWRRIRKVVLARDGYVCQIRGPRCTTTATQADHVVSWRELPEERWLDVTLLRAACRSCNAQKGARRQAELAEIGRQALRARYSQFRDW
jgi:5-methylcytosine-specific restriction endonuclease McrA